MSVDDDIDEKIQEAVEQKVEERLDEERDRIKEEVREELLQEDAETSREESDDGQNYSRRGFLKALGLGAGGLALSSAASADLLSLNTVAGDKTQNLGNILQNSNSASTGIDMNGNPITDSTGGPVDINADRLDGNQASNFATANDLSNHAGVTGAHHTKYTDENAQDAVGNILGSNLNYDDTNNNISLNQGSGSGLDSDQVDGFDIQKNGNNTNGVINLDTNNNTITIDGDVVVAQVLQATGGTTVTTFTDNNGQQYRIHAFENTGTSTFTVNSAPPNSKVDVLVVGGGGGGGGHVPQGSYNNSGGGGGAGGVVEKQKPNLSIGDFTIQVGGGGSNVLGDHGRNGGDSTAFGFTAIGGGGGGTPNDDENSSFSNIQRGRDGGSGGGASGNVRIDSNGNIGEALQPGSTDGGFGNDGGSVNGTDQPAGGGGGATQAGDDGSDSSPVSPGGDGVDFSNKYGTQFGENGVFAGGGGAGGSRQHGPESGGAGGSGGGGRGGDSAEKVGDSDAHPPGGTGSPGQQNTGGGGGGAGSGNDPNDEWVGYDGGSGIVLIRYEI